MAKKLNAWMAHVANVRKQHPGLSLMELLKKAKDSYKKPASSSVDLSAADLSAADLSAADLSAADLTRSPSAADPSAIKCGNLKFKCNTPK